MRNPGQSGLTLLEVLIAVVILGIASVILMAASRGTVAGQLRSKVYGDVAVATKEALEEIQLLTMDEVTKLSATSMPHSQGPSVTVRATARSVKPTDVTDFAALDTSSLRHLTLAASFPGHAGDPVERTFTTIVFKP
jgi:prepilin-type N-terminal cleavage/methylation domain-containing protein